MREFVKGGPSEMTKFNKALVEAMKLSADDRRDLAAILLESIGPPVKLTPEQEEQLRRSVEEGGEISAAELLARLRARNP